MTSLFNEDMRRNPYPIYEQMRAASPALHVPAANLWAIFDYEGVKRALTDQESFSSNVSPSRGLSFEWLLFMEPAAPWPPARDRQQGIHAPIGGQPGASRPPALTPAPRGRARARARADGSGGRVRSATAHDGDRRDDQ